MNLRTRLTVAVVAVSSAGTLVLGGLFISEVRASKLAAVDQVLTSVTSQVRAQASDQLAAGLFAAEQSPISVALGFVSQGTEFTWVRDLTDEELPAPSTDELARGKVGVITTEAGYRMLGVRLRDGETLVTAASVRSIDEQTYADIVFVLSFWLLLSLVKVIVVRILVRRDVTQLERLIEAASALAAGADSVEIPTAASSEEVRVLAESLRRMVLSLRGALEAEQATTVRMQEFLGDASHELRTPLTVIKGYLELLEREVEPAQRERAMLRMRAEAQRMELLVNDLLLLAEIGTPIQEAAEVMDLTALVRVLVDDLSELQPERAVESTIDSGVLVRAVPSHLHRAVANAFANIRRHTGVSDRVRVSLRTDATAAVLVVEDGGPGLAREMYVRGMSHFQRFDKSRSRASGGSGLGMSIIAAVMQELGGSVSIGPSELGGLRLRYRFPLAR